MPALVSLLSSADTDSGKYRGYEIPTYLFITNLFSHKNVGIIGTQSIISSPFTDLLW